MTLIEKLQPLVDQLQVSNSSQTEVANAAHSQVKAALAIVGEYVEATNSHKKMIQEGSPELSPVAYKRCVDRIRTLLTALVLTQETLRLEVDALKLTVGDMIVVVSKEYEEIVALEEGNDDSVE